MSWRGGWVWPFELVFQKRIASGNPAKFLSYPAVGVFPYPHLAMRERFLNVTLNFSPQVETSLSAKA
jgi:hypothetical protein